MIEDKVRTPVRGLRVKLRNLLKHEYAITEKFSIEHHRRFGLIVAGVQDINKPTDLIEFEGFPVKFI